MLNHIEIMGRLGRDPELRHRLDRRGGLALHWGVRE